MGYDRKYGRVTTERGTIGDDEPVVVVRAQDRLMPYLLEYYRDLCIDAGSPQHHLDLIEGTCQAVIEWQKNNFTKIPNSETYQPGEAV